MNTKLIPKSIEMIQNQDIRSFLINKGAEFIEFVDISSLSEKQNKEISRFSYSFQYLF